MAYLVAKEAVHYYCSASVLQISQVLALKFISVRNQTAVLYMRMPCGRPLPIHTP